MKNAPMQAVRGQNADQRKRNRHHDDERRRERAEPADHQHVDQHEHDREGDAEVAEHLEVMCHSPSHFIAGVESLKGWAAL